MRAMFTIRQTQYSAMADFSRTGFIRRMEVHLNEHFPSAFRDWTRPQIRDFVIRNWYRATGYGLTTELAVCTYLEAASSLGEDFTLNKAWAQPLLEHECQEADKLRSLNQRVLAEVYPAEPL